MSVKKVKVEKLHVVSAEVPHRTMRRFLVSMVLVLVAVVSFAAGLLKGKNDQIIAEQERDVLKRQLASLETEYNKLAEDRTNLEKGEEIINQATEMCRVDVKQCRQEVAELKATVLTYKNLMNPDTNEKGLKIHKWDVVRTVNPERFEYSIVIAQVSDNTRYISGSVTIDLVGYLNGQQKVYSLSEIATSAQSFNFRMKYLKEWQGEFVLPEGFTPDKFEIAVQANKNKRVAHSYKWELESINPVEPVVESPVAATSNNPGVEAND